MFPTFTRGISRIMWPFIDGTRNWHACLAGGDLPVSVVVGGHRHRRVDGWPPGTVSTGSPSVLYSARTMVYAVLSTNRL
jgi:hypothetical protein